MDVTPDEEDEMCAVCGQLRRCVALLPARNVYLCMVCLADAMVLLAPDKLTLTPEQYEEFQQYLDNRPGG